MNYLERSIRNKKIIWFGTSNQYILLELPAYEVMKKILDGEPEEQIIKFCSTDFHLPKAESKRFVSELTDVIKKNGCLYENDAKLLSKGGDETHPDNFFSKKSYLIQDQCFEVNYETPQLEYQVHPRFAHLETDVSLTADHIFSVYMTKNLFTLEVDRKVIGYWEKSNIHYFTGKFSMELLNCLYNKTEKDWLGVFHASAIQYNDCCALFLGDSGSGKSTLAAILMSEGFKLVADDFVPVDATGNVNSFPAAVSVKASAIDSLKTLFPKLENAKEYFFPTLNKIVRYLVQDPLIEIHNKSVKCKALVFVKYVKDSGMLIEELPAEVAFQRLVPDSWISPEVDNANCFLDWFLSLPCYQLIYSDNKKMVKAVKQLLGS